jgi:hypothetical protein
MCRRSPTWAEVMNWGLFAIWLLRRDFFFSCQNKWHFQSNCVTDICLSDLCLDELFRICVRLYFTWDMEIWNCTLLAYIRLHKIRTHIWHLESARWRFSTLSLVWFSVSGFPELNLWNSMGFWVSVLVYLSYSMLSLWPPRETALS